MHKTLSKTNISFISDFYCIVLFKQYQDSPDIFLTDKAIYEMKILEFLELTMLNRYVIAFNYCQVTVNVPQKIELDQNCLKAVKY